MKKRLMRLKKPWRQPLLRSSHWRCSVRKDVFRNFAKFKGKHLCQSLFFNEVADWGLQLYSKRDSGTGVFLWIFAKFLRTPFLNNTSGHLLLSLDHMCFFCISLLFLSFIDSLIHRIITEVDTTLVKLWHFFKTPLLRSNGRISTSVLGAIQIVISYYSTCAMIISEMDIQLSK